MEENKFEKLESIKVEALDKILGLPFKVLDDGFVRVVDYMGSDQSIVQAARVSYGAGTKKSMQDKGLIRYLMRHRHSTPFEMCEIKLHVRVPMDCWRQWIRHRTANVNEYSTRYSLAIESAQSTNPDEWRIQSTSNRQGSKGSFGLEVGEQLSKEENEFHEFARKIYNHRIELGIAREQARKDLPLSTYTEAYWKIDLHNLLHFLELRMDPHAQLEIRKYSEIIGFEIVKKWVPLVWEAFEDYRLNSLYLSGREAEIIRLINQGKVKEVFQSAENNGWLEKKENGTLKQNLERIELEEKLEKLNMNIPWKEFYK
ncbi:MAG: thymidylate synthase (FAD) [Ignavibacteriales bacterium CG_4_9_14_3_um_filter_34_10]|nr:MAG: thymidylate synthase (FAD) [Ignavibacteriales bacterium CG_4_9_14_3_um_filter_34_10]